MYSNIRSTFVVLWIFCYLSVHYCTAEQEGNICDRKPYLLMCRHKDKDLLQHDLPDEIAEKNSMSSSVLADKNSDGVHNDSHNNNGSTDINDLLSDTINNGTSAKNVTRDPNDYIYGNGEPAFFEYKARREQLLNRIQTLDEEANKLQPGQNEYKTAYSNEYPSSYTYGGGCYTSGYTYPAASSSSYGYPYAGSGGYMYPTYSNSYGGSGYPGYGGGYAGGPGNAFNFGLGSGLNIEDYSPELQLRRMELLKQLRQLEEEHLARKTYSSYNQKPNCVNYPPYSASGSYYQSGCYPPSSYGSPYPDYNSQIQSPYYTQYGSNGGSSSQYGTQYGTGTGLSQQYGYGNTGYGSTSPASGNLFGIGSGFNIGLPGMGVGLNSGLGVNLG
ncbi:hypothetical protein Ddc_09515 [Ditylenchus destructor]|nr:hypothetical protein Ddc_09515 [Ditylenchus destructor]